MTEFRSYRLCSMSKSTIPQAGNIDFLLVRYIPLQQRMNRLARELMSRNRFFIFCTIFVQYVLNCLFTWK